MLEVEKFHGFAFWAWNIDVDNCAICRKHIMDHLCIECQEQKDSIKDYIMDLCIECQEQKDSIKECICASGQCSHSFYFHSMQRWLKTRNVCPMHSLAMGRTSSESRRRTQAERTRSSAPLYVSITRPTGLLLRGRCLSIISTKSFSWTFLRG